MPHDTSDFRLGLPVPRGEHTLSETVTPTDIP